MNIYVIRHGESVANRDGIIQGSTIDPNLSPVGIEQAKKLHTSRSLPTDPTHVFSSPFLRTRQTAMYGLGHLDENFDIRLE